MNKTELLDKYARDGESRLLLAFSPPPSKP